MTPIELLTAERDKLTKSLRKSAEQYKAGLIDFDTHEVHMFNLVPQIIIWNQAVITLQRGT